MKVFETSKEVGLFSMRYELSIACSIDATDAIASEFDRIKETLVEWQQRRGKDCAKLGLIFLAHEPFHDAILDHARGALTTDEVMGPFTQRLSVDVVLLDGAGKACRRIKLGNTAKGS